jgi:hypothetical protein
MWNPGFAPAPQKQINKQTETFHTRQKKKKKKKTTIISKRKPISGMSPREPVDNIYILYKSVYVFTQLF